MDVEAKRLVRQLKKEGFDENTGPARIAFYLPSMKNSQLVYSLVYEINQYVINNIGINCLIFTDDIINKCVIPKCTVLHSLYMMGYDGNLVFVSYKDLANCNKASRAKKLYYIYDYAADRKLIEIDPNNILQNDIILFTRSKDYYDTISKQRKISPIIVPDANVKTIMEIISNDSK